MPGALANFYLTGTTTRTDTYSDSALTTPHDNPVVADAAGIFPAIYLDPDIDYKLTLTTSTATLIYTVDPVIDTLTAANIGAALYPRTSAETAAGITPTNYQYEPGNVLRYGTNTTPGTTDMTTAFNNAFLVAIEANSTVIVPSGLYRWDSQVSVNGSCDYRQSKSALISSYVTGSVDEYDSAGFALLIDGMSEANWYGFNLDFENGTAGVLMRCRNGNTRRNSFFAPKVDGGAFNTSRQTRTKIVWRITGNEASASSTGNLVYFNRFFGPHFVSASTLVDCVTGDGDSSTNQPNAQIFEAPVFEDYITAFSTPDSDEHQLLDAFWQLASGIAHGTGITSITQSSGTATVTHTSHGYLSNDIVTIAGANESEYNGAKRITVTGTNTYTFTIDSGAASPATGTLTATLNTVGFRGRCGFLRLSGIIDVPSGAYPYWLYDGSGHSVLDVVENTGVGGIVEDTTDHILSFNNSRMNGLARINDRSHDVDGDADVDIFGTGTAAQGGDGLSKVRVWGNLGSTRNIELGVNGTTATIRANVANTDLALGAGGETVILLDDSLNQAVIPTGKYLGFTDTQTTVGSAGGAASLPATPDGYLPVRVGGAVRVIPYYAAS